MNGKISHSTELIAFFVGFAIFFPINFLLRKRLIPTQFDLLNLVGLTALILITLLHVYWKITSQQGAPVWQILWVALIGGCAGTWVVYRFVDSAI